MRLCYTEQRARAPLRSSPIRPYRLAGAAARDSRSSRRSNGQWRPVWPIEPDRSANRTVTSRRFSDKSRKGSSTICSDGPPAVDPRGAAGGAMVGVGEGASADAAATGEPQLGQKRCVGRSDPPQAAQRRRGADRGASTFLRVGMVQDGKRRVPRSDPWCALPGRRSCRRLHGVSAGESEESALRRRGCDGVGTACARCRVRRAPGGRRARRAPPARVGSALPLTSGVPRAGAVGCRLVRLPGCGPFRWR